MLSTATLAAPRSNAKERLPSVLAIGGDGIGNEVVAAAVQCLKALGTPLQIIEPPHGKQTVQTEGTAFPAALREQCRTADAILFGACGDISNEILRFLRFGLDTYANLRPTRSLPGVPLASGIRPVGWKADLVIVREATEGFYPGREGELAEFNIRWPEFHDRLGRPLPNEGRFALRVITEQASARIGRYAALLAARRKKQGVGPGRVTVVSKANVLRHTDGLFHAICEREAKAIDGLTVDHLYVDEAARRLVARPESFDVIVTTNLFGDVLSDVAAEAMGGLPLAPSAGIGDRYAYFEPVHGSAPDIAGKGVANPTGAILSAALMVAYLGHDTEAERLERAVAMTLQEGPRTADLGGSASTAHFTEAVCQALAQGTP